MDFRLYMPLQNKRTDKINKYATRTYVCVCTYFNNLIQKRKVINENYRIFSKQGTNALWVVNEGDGGRGVVMFFLATAKFLSALLQLSNGQLLVK